MYTAREEGQVRFQSFETYTSRPPRSNNDYVTSCMWDYFERSIM